MGLGFGLGLGFRGGSRLGIPKFTPELIGKFIAWFKPAEEQPTYYINKIGDQERETLSQSGVAGVVHPGRAIQFTGSKSQSSTSVVTPTNFRLVNNSISFSFNIKVGVTPPSSSIPVWGNIPNVGSGRYYMTLESDGRLVLSVRHSLGSLILNTVSVVTDNAWHNVFVVIDKLGDLSLYLDNEIQLSPLSMSGLVFGDINDAFKIGSSGVNTHSFQLRDVRMFPFAITSRTDRDTIIAGEYFAGASGWWMMESGKADAIYKIKDCIGTCHFTNTNFDASSIVTGNWLSLFNKFGYANSFTGTDLLAGAGTFDNAAKWTINATRYNLTGGTLNWLAAGDTANNCVSVDTITLSNNGYYEWQHTVTSGTARVRLVSHAGTEVFPVADYAVGLHKVVFKPLVASTKFVIQSYSSGGAYSMDDVTIGAYEAGYISPSMVTNPPTVDTAGRALVFVGQAKYNLTKVDANTVKFQDNISEVFSAAEQISVNDWYDAAGIGLNVTKADIEYQSNRQYYNNGELIIVKADAVLSNSEDNLIRNYLKLGTPTKIYFPVKLALGTKTGTTAQIYATQRAMLDEAAYIQEVEFTPVKQDLDPTQDYLAIEWADFFQTDVNTIIPLAAKYGFANTFYRQIRPASDNPLTTIYYNRAEMPLIEQSGQVEGNHGFMHIAYLGCNALYDGLTTPSNDDLRVDRGNGTNEFGHPLTETVDESVTSGIRLGWMRLSELIGATTWANLTDADCQAFRGALGMFTIPLDGQGGASVLETMDILSARYCGTTGTSVYLDDYTSVRVPNTVDGLAPSTTNRILGGIFQGCATTQNHEIWERVLKIDNDYKVEFEYLNTPHLSYGTPGGSSKALIYHPVSEVNTGYHDRLHTQLFSGAAKFTSSLTGLSRSRHEALRNAGYLVTTVALGEGYKENGFDNALNNKERLEAQRIFKKGGVKKIDTIGDGYINAMRSWDPSIPEADQETLLTSVDLIKDLYDYTFTDPRYAGMDASGSTPPYHAILNTLTKYNAWGVTPDCGADSSTGTVAGRASMALVMEALYQFCLRAGVKVISLEEATILSHMALPLNYNYFPNPTFRTLAKTITGSTNAPTYPDGWNGGLATAGELKFTVGTFFTRQYAIKAGVANISIKTKGIGTLIIRKISNTSIYSNTSGAAFTIVKTYVLNSVDYVDLVDTLTIPDEPLVNYPTPTTPRQELDQSYMKGYDNKWCGLHIEVVVAGANELYIKEPIINIT